METIRSYVNNIFAPLPHTERLLKLKEELLSTMEDKYNELKAEGKSENEAIGIVISEFGSVDELKAELGLDGGNTTDESAKKSDVPTVRISEDEAKAYLRSSRRFGRSIGFGVFLLIFAFGAYTLTLCLMGYETTGQYGSFSAIGAVSMFACIVIGLAMVISSGIGLDRLGKRYTGSRVELPAAFAPILEDESNGYTSRFAISIAVGLALCATAPIVLYATELSGMLTTNLKLAILLGSIGLGVMLFIISGTRKDSYDHMLGAAFNEGDDDDDDDNDDDEELKRSSRVYSVISAIYWPMVVAAYLLWSFIGGAWNISWLIFPIAGLLYSSIGGLCRAFLRR